MQVQVRPARLVDVFAFRHGTSLHRVEGSPIDAEVGAASGRRQVVSEHREPKFLAVGENVLQVVLVSRLLDHRDFVRKVFGRIVRLKFMAARNDHQGEVLGLVVLVGLAGRIEA